MDVEAFLSRMNKQGKQVNQKQQRHQSLNYISQMPKAKSANPRTNKNVRYQQKSNPNPFIPMEDYSR